MKRVRQFLIDKGHIEASELGLMSDNKVKEELKKHYLILVCLDNGSDLKRFTNRRFLLPKDKGIDMLTDITCWM